MAELGITLRAMSGRQSTLLFFGLLVACAPAADRAQPGDASATMRPSDSTANRPSPDSISRPALVSHEDPTLVRFGEIPSAVRVACDSASAITHEALALAVHREEGNYFDSPRETPRTGCRLTGKGSFKTVPDQSGPVDALHNSFIRHGWRHDLRYGADGPDGASVGMRRRDMLCLVSGRWNGGDDSDPDTSRTNQDDSYQIFVECARDVAPNNDGEVPDSIWRIATTTGLDSVYAISMSVRSPPYIDGDFDGNGVMDAAVLVERRSTGKLGLAIVNRGTRKVTILGAGSGSVGPDDLEWIDRWERFHKESIDLTIRDRPNIQFVGDAIWIARGDSVSGFYGWTGRAFVYEAHKR